MSSDHHGAQSSRREISSDTIAIMNRFADQINKTARREYPSGRMGADDEGALSYAVTADKAKEVVIIRYGKSVEWIGMSATDAMTLAKILIQKVREISKEPLVLEVSEFQQFTWNKLEKMQAEIAQEIRQMLGENAYDQRIFTDADRIRRIEAMQKCAAEKTTDAERHEAWMKMHVEQGWVYGEKLEPAKKEHPNLLPWEKLPASTRHKANIFDIISKTGAALVAEYGKVSEDEG